MTGRGTDGIDGAMNRKKAVCVFCGSSARVDQKYRDAATEFGRELGSRGYDLIYGGGRVGLMGLVADAAIAAGARVTGVIPRFLQDLEVGHHGIHELVVTETMHDRKRQMYERADAFATLPGGLGTLDETFEVLTWSQLGLSSKPVVLVDVDGFWQPLLDLVDHVVETGFARPENRSLCQVAASIDEAFARIEDAPAAAVRPEAKWV